MFDCLQCEQAAASAFLVGTGRVHAKIFDNKFIVIRVARQRIRISIRSTTGIRDSDDASGLATDKCVMRRSTWIEDNRTEMR